MVIHSSATTRAAIFCPQVDKKELRQKMLGLILEYGQQLVPNDGGKTMKDILEALSLSCIDVSSLFAAKKTSEYANSFKFWTKMSEEIKELENNI